MTGIPVYLVDKNGHPFKDMDGKLSVDTASMLDITQGKVAGLSTYNKYGRNIEIDSGVTADIWDGGHTLASGGVSLNWVAPTQARIHDIVSSSANDTLGGSGARTIRIYGLPTWHTKEVSEDIALNGTNSVATRNAYVIIYRMKVTTKGNTNVNAGVIKATARIDNTITAQIRIDQGQTQMAVFGVPSVQIAYMGRLYANMEKSGGASGGLDLDICVNPEPDVEETMFLVKHTWSLISTATSSFSVPFWVPKVIEGPALIKVRALSGANDMDVSAGFDLILVDN